MGMLTGLIFMRAAQDGEAAQDAGARSAEIAESAEPLITGTDTALWVGFAAFITIFLVVIIAIIRGRVIKPAERIAEDATFFEPAGADAEITFEDPDDAEQKEQKSFWGRRKKNRDRKSGEEETDANADDTRGSDYGDLGLEPAQIAEEPEDNDEDDRTEKKSRAPFAGLFARRSDVEDEPDIPETVAPAPVDDGDELAEITIQREGDSDFLAEPVTEPARAEQDYWDTERDRREAMDTETRQREEFERAEADRRHALEEAARARAEAEESRRRLEAAQADTEREAAFERRKAEAALEQRMQSLAAMQHKISEKADTLSSDTQAVHHRLGASLDQKFSALSAELYEKLNAAASNLSKLSADIRPQTAFDSSAAATPIAAELEKLRETTDRLSDRIDNLSAAQAAAPGDPDDLRRLNKLLAERAAPAVAGAIQLSDLVRNALPADRFTFDQTLKNGATVDCLIKTPGNKAPFAVDARYPVEAFEKYARSDDDERPQAETAYRRAVLRHMIFVAEKLIAPGETADFAILFVPNDTIFNDLHRHFADIVQDSYRARIWITSPTSLMATLHMMSAAAARFAEETKRADETRAADEALKTQIETLSERIERLEGDLARAGAAAASASVAKPEEPPVNLAPDIREEDLADYLGQAAPAEASPEPEEAGPAPEAEPTAPGDNAPVSRPPFPLR